MERNDDVSKPFLFSLLAHLTIVFVFTIKATFFPSTDDSYLPALRVDIVGLPDKVTPANNTDSSEARKEESKNEPTQTQNKETNELPTTKGPKLEKMTNSDDALLKSVKSKSADKSIDKSIDKPDLVLKNKQKEEQDKFKSEASQAIEKLKKKMAIDKIKEEVIQKERQDLSQRVAQYKGNVITPGTELRGVAKLQYDDFLGNIDRHVKHFWSLPEWLARGDFKAKVKVFIDSRGLLTGVELVSSSGNSSYDEIVMETVKKAVPFPNPPEKFRDKLSVDGMVLGFPE